MRGLALLSVAVLGACGNSPGVGDDDGLLDPDAPIDEKGPSFTMESPEIEILGSQRITYCWYFRTPNQQLMAITKWSSTMSAPGARMIVYTTASERMPPGTVSAVNCGPGSGSLGSQAGWTFAAREAAAEMALPSDDGTGRPLAMELAANQPGFVQIFFDNSGADATSARVVVTAEALRPDTPYTATAGYATFNGNISIPPMTSNHTQELSCGVPASAHFWAMSTHTHERATRTRVKDGGAMVFENLSWEHPKMERWTADSFYSFASGKLTYECTWNNPTNRTITTGNNADTDEVCMAAGYFFPATKPVFCFNESAM